MSGAQQAAIEGAWVPVAADVSGHALLVRELRVARLLLEHGDYRIVDHDADVVDSGVYVLDDGVSPHSMDIVGRSGPNAGRTMRAVYELEADRLTVCYDIEGRERPTSMRPNAEPDRHLLTITYARASAVLS